MSVIQVNFYRDAEGRIWQGPTHPEDNLHYSRWEGGSWVLRRSDPDPAWTEFTPTEWPPT